MSRFADLFVGDVIGWYSPKTHKKLVSGRVAYVEPRGLLVEWDNGMESLLRPEHFRRGWARAEDKDQLPLFGAGSL